MAVTSKAVIDIVLELLSDGQWHILGELTEYVQANKTVYGGTVEKTLRDYSTLKSGNSVPFYRHKKKMILNKQANEKGYVSYKLTVFDSKPFVNKAGFIVKRIEEPQGLGFDIPEGKAPEKEYTWLQNAKEKITK